MATVLCLIYMPSRIAGVATNVANGGAVQYGVETRTTIPVLVGPTHTTKSEYDGGSQFHIHDEPMPFNVNTASGGSADPVGIQRWPLKA